MLILPPKAILSSCYFAIKRIDPILRSGLCTFEGKKNLSGKTPQGTGVSANILVPSPLSEMAIGEQFLDNVEPSDLIADQYKDSFKDVKPARQEWYQRHYSPVLQKKVEKWRLIIPKLKERSAKRIAQNADYQRVLKRMRHERLTQLPSFEGDVGTLQLQEAYQIVADMIALDHN